MNKQMNHPEYEYAYWYKSINGETTYWIKVKTTGEIAQCNSREQWMEINKAERDYCRIEKNWDRLVVFSYDALSGGTLDHCFGDNSTIEKEIVFSIVVEDFRKTLTPVQLDLFDECICSGESLRSYTARMGKSPGTTHKTLVTILEKLKNFKFF